MRVVILALFFCGSMKAQFPVSGVDVVPEAHVATSIPAADGGVFDVAAFLGADRYYNAGIAGENTVTWNLEAGHIWNGHDALAHVTRFSQSADTFGGGDFASLYDRHATWVGMLIGGRPASGVTTAGMAPATDLRSAALSTGWTGSAYALGFGISIPSYLHAFESAFASGDVVNSSYGFADPGGSSILTIFSDAVAFQSPSTAYVVSAGNSGPGGNTVGSPGSGYNAITVGALAGANTFEAPASFSSRGPQDFAFYSNGTVTVVSGVRAAVDIAAPGASLASAYYGGQTGGNDASLPGSTAGPSSTSLFSSGLNGTSFAAPIVAGGAALVHSAAEAFHPANPEASSSLVVKAQLLTAADKTAGWSNNQTLSGNVITTSQALDFSTGAGRMNLDRTFLIQNTGQGGVEGLSAGAQVPVQELGWDFGEVGAGSSNDYPIADSLAGNSTFTATLVWHRAREWDSANGTVTESAQADLNLSLWALGENDSFARRVAESVSLYNPVEHFSFSIPETGRYGLRVSYVGNTFDNTGGVWGGTGFEQPYALAWNGEALTALFWQGGAAWDGDSLVWNTSASGNGTARYATHSSTEAVFSGGNVLLSGDREAGGLRFEAGPTNFSSSAPSTLSIGSGGVSANSSVTFSDGIDLHLVSSQVWMPSSDLEVAGTLAGNATLGIAGNGTTRLTGSSSGNGISLRVEDGRVEVSGNYSSLQGVVVGAGGTLGGSGGRVGNLVLEAGGALAPGNSPGALFSEGNATWTADGRYDWQSLAANPDSSDQSKAGVFWDLWDIAEALNLVSPDPSRRFSLHLESLVSATPDTPGPLAAYDPAVGSTWLIARAGGGVFHNGDRLLPWNDYTSLFDVRTSPFEGSGGWSGHLPPGGFRVWTLGSDDALYLVAAVTGVPEPSQILVSLMVVGGAALGIFHRRLRALPNHKLRRISFYE